jgi:fructokinase
VIEASGCVRLGVDLGGTKIEIAALDAADNERLRRRVLSPRDDYDATVRAVRGLVAAAEAELGETASVGIGTPGAISPATGLVKNANSTWLNGRPLHRDLAAALSREIRIANDADCFALSEASDGAGAGARTVFGVILGTGVGGGIVRDGALLSGPNAIAGEWGHNPLPWPEPDEWPGPPCYCGRTGCAETFLSGPGLSADHVRAGGADLPAAEIATRATGGDLAAAVTMTRYADRLARALAAVINLLDPDVIVLGGGLSNLDALYTAVPPLWPRFVFSDTVATRLVRNRHGDSSGVRGAARLWPAPT